MSQAPVEEQDVFARQLNSKEKKKKVSFWRIAGVSVLALGGVAGAYFAFTKPGRQTLQQGSDAFHIVNAIREDPELLFTHVGHDEVNVLIVGEDYNWKVGEVLNPKTGKKAPFQVIDTDSPPRSDTMIVMALNRASGNLRMVSMPRDARITYTDLDGDRHRRRKLNSVYSTGGNDPQKRQELLRSVISDELGIRIDRFAAIKPNSFKALVDLVGGVYVNVDGALKLDRKTGKQYRGHIFYQDNWAQWKVDLDPGPQWLNGEQAHGYVRFRKDREGDPGRIRRQQDVMKALAKRINELPKWKLPGLMKQIQEQFRTDMTEEELASLAIFAKNHGMAGKIQPLTLYGIYASNGDIILNRDKNEKLLPVIFGGAFDPKKFLVQSPSTEGDDIGPANNGNPAVQSILRQAGLLDENEIRSAENSVANVPVRTGEESPSERTSRRRYASATERTSDDTPAASSTDEERPRRRRRRRERREETTPVTAPSHESDAASVRAEMGSSEPEPASEPEASTESPVPQPEEHAPAESEPPAESPVPRAE